MEEKKTLELNDEKLDEVTGGRHLGLLRKPWDKPEVEPRKVGDPNEFSVKE